MDCWQKLGIAETVDKREIKRAYGKLVKQHHPESDPKEFQAVREAYEEALWFAEYSKNNESEGAEQPPALESAGAPAQQTQSVERTAAELREKDKVRDAQVETIDAALAKLVPLLQRDEAIAIAFCRTTLKESFFQALDVRYEFEGKLLITLLQNDIFPFAFLKYLTGEFEWDINMNRPGRMVIGHFDNDVRYSGAFYAVARRYLAEMVRRALRVHLQNTHSWIAAERFDRLDALLFTENRESELAEFCKGKQDREMVESGIAFLIRNQYITNHSSFVPWKTVQWLFDNDIARPPTQPRPQPAPQPQAQEERSGFPGWAAWLVVVIAIRLVAAIATDSPSSRPVSMPSAPSSNSNSRNSDIYAFPPEEMTRVMQLQRDAESGNRESQYLVGLEYLKGSVLSKDTRKAVQWLRLSADQEYAPARERLGVLYYTGQGVVKDYKLAMEMLNWAADHDRADATYWLGKAYDDGIAVEQNVVKARQLMDRAVKLGSIEAMRAKAARPLYVQKNKPATVIGQDYLTEAAEKGNFKAAYQLAQQYLSGYQREVNYAEAYKWLNDPSLQENPFAQLWLSQLYEKGLGVRQNSVQSDRLLAKAEKQLSPDSLNNLAMQLTFHPNKQLRNGNLASNLMEHVLTDPRNHTAARFNTLASAYAEAGNFEKAIATEQQAINALATDPKATLDKHAEYEERVKRYRNGQTAFR